MKRLMLFLMLAIPGLVVAQKLIPCPDCGKMVSPRAFMCPACGCRGEVIEKLAQEVAERAKPKEPDSHVVADFGSRRCKALPVKMNDGMFVVMPLEQVLDVETLEFRFASTNLTINYGTPEVALDKPVIRFPITETNLTFAAATTNVCSTLAQPKEVLLSSAAGWAAIQPKALKNHGRILLGIKNDEDVHLPPTAHPFYRKLEALWSMKGNGK